MPMRIHVNGEMRLFDGDPATPLLGVLRQSFLLTGTKDVCGEGFCGACTVHVEGEARVSCLTPVAMVENRQISTIEGLDRDDEGGCLLKALEEHDAVQCGMCFPGVAMTLACFLKDNPGATRVEVKRGLSGNICRCTGYERIVDAALSLLANRRAGQ